MDYSPWDSKESDTTEPQNNKIYNYYMLNRHNQPFHLTSEEWRLAPCSSSPEVYLMRKGESY